MGTDDQRCGRCGTEFRGYIAREESAVRAVQCETCGGWNRPPETDAASFTAVYTNRPGAPGGGTPDCIPQILTVFACSAVDAMELAKSLVPWGATFHWLVQTDDAPAVINGVELLRMDRPPGALICVYCRSENITPRRVGREWGWTSCSECGQEMSMEQASGADRDSWSAHH